MFLFTAKLLSYVCKIKQIAFFEVDKNELLRKSITQ